MSRINVKDKVVVTTHEGGKAHVTTPVNELYRAVMTCMLWEDTFYD
jgi:hypothetical protein